MIDAIEMAIVTVSTVGYGKVHPLSPPGKIFNIVFIIMGSISLMSVVATASAFLVEGEFIRILRRTRMEKSVAKMKNHYIVCGLGQAGHAVVTEFLDVGKSFVVIDKSSTVMDLFPGMSPFPFVVGDATEDEILKQAGVERARGMIVATDSDADNLYIVLSARSLNQDIRIVVRAIRDESEAKLIKAGADNVVALNRIGGMRMASTLLRPEVVTFLDVMTKNEEMSLRIEEAIVTEGSSLAGITLREAEIPNKTGLMVIAIRHKDSYTFNPNSNSCLSAGDVLIVLGSQDRVKKLRELVAG
jgi:voltage-gated potassium channel